MSTERKPTTDFDLSPGAHIHLMGICGTAMASLAGLLKTRGFKVTGSDQNVYPPMSTQLASLGIAIQTGYRKENLTPAPDLVVVGNVITRKNEEAIALLESAIPFCSLPQAMGALAIGNRHSVVVAGTHGKTTTTAMNAFVADELGLKPGFMIGGIPKNFGVSFRNAEGDWFVIEGDEYDTAFFDKVPKFVHYRPRSVILNSIEFDHADIYRDLDHVKEAFLKLLGLIAKDGVLIACADEPTIADVISRSSAALAENGVRVITFGLTGGDYRAENLRSFSVTETRLGTRFDLIRPVHQGVTPPRLTIDLDMMGSYNVKNAIATIALWEQQGFTAETLAPLLLKFKGVKRRQEILGEPGGVTVIEDFAHHPTAVRETILTVQRQYPKSKVFSVFEFRSATSRRAIFQKEYTEAFSVAQAVLFPPLFNAAALPENDRMDILKIVEALKSKRIDARIKDSVTEIVETLATEAHSGDVVLIMSNGGFDGIYEKLLQKLGHTMGQ